MKEAFLGNKELFYGLHLYDNWDWDKKYPVIHISFSEIFREKKNLEKTIDSLLDTCAKEYGVSSDQYLISEKFRDLILKFEKKIQFTSSSTDR